MRACVDKEKCIGCGLCASLAPDVFRMDDEGTAEAIDKELPENLRNDAEDARDQCPVEAITVEK